MSKVKVTLLSNVRHGVNDTPDDPSTNVVADHVRGDELEVEQAEADQLVQSGVATTDKKLANQVKAEVDSAPAADGPAEPLTPESSDQADAETIANLKNLSRDELNQRAADLGVAEPEKLANREKVIEAIQEAGPAE